LSRDGLDALVDEAATELLIHTESGWPDTDQATKERRRWETEVVVTATLGGLCQRIAKHLHADDRGHLSGPLGEAIATAAGNYSTEFVTPEDIAEGFLQWFKAALPTEDAQ